MSTALAGDESVVRSIKLRLARRASVVATPDPRRDRRRVLGEPKRWRLTNLLLLLGPLLLPDADSLDLRLLARGGVGLRERGDDVGSDQDVEDQDGDDGGDRVAVVGAGTLEVSREDKPRTRR